MTYMSSSQRERNIGVCGSKLHSRIAKFFQYQVRDKKWFQTTIILIICLAGVLVGVQTYEIQDQSMVNIIA